MAWCRAVMENKGRARAWLWLQTFQDCIKQCPCYVSKSCCTLLISCEIWAYAHIYGYGYGDDNGYGYRAEHQWCCNVMVEAPNLLTVHPTSISYVYTVFQHLDMLWMGICVRPYTAMLPVQVGCGFYENWAEPRPECLLMSWLRLQTHLECIPHPYNMYKKSFITFICCGWAYECTFTLVCLWRLGVFLRKLGSDWAQVML